MNKKLVSKIALCLMLVIAIIAIATPFAFCASSTNPGEITITAPNDDGAVSNIGGQVIGIIQAIGSVVAVGILVVVGIKYMLGSAEEKADFKKAMIPYLVGAVLVFAASQVAGAVYKMVVGLGNN